MTPAPLSFFVKGKPVPKGRPRMTKTGHTYTPKRTVVWEQTVAWGARVAMQGRPLFIGPMRVQLAFAGAHGSADVDNLAKACLDAMNAVCYVDDRQVRELEAVRIHGEPGVLVELWELP